MKSVKHNKVSGFAAKALAFTFAFGLAACSEAEKPRDPETPPISDEPNVLTRFTFAFDASGNIVVKDAEGNAVGEECSPDPKSKDVCPIFKPGHKVQVEQALDLSMIRYTGSPQCVMVQIGGRWYVLPNAALCK